MTPDSVLLTSLETQGNVKLLAKYALQHSFNRIHEAHTYLSAGVSQTLRDLLLTELAQTGRSKYESMMTRKLVTGSPASDLQDDVAFAETLKPRCISIIPSNSIPPNTSLGAQETGDTIPIAPVINDNMSNEGNSLMPSLKLLQELLKELDPDLLVLDPDEGNTLIATDHETTATNSFLSVIPPPPPPMPKPTQNVNISVKRVKHKLHWDEIKVHELDKQNTVWRQDQIVETLSLDRSRFEDLFCTQPGQNQTGPMQSDVSSRYISGNYNQA